MLSIRAGAMAAALALAVGGHAVAWDRGDVETFAVVPDIAPGVSSTIEGLTVGPNGNVYVPSFGFNSSGPVTTVPNGVLFEFGHDGQLVRKVTIANSSPHLLGLAFNPVSGDLLVCDFGGGKMLKVDPLTGASSVFFVPPNAAASGLNALTFDKKGNVYVSDSFQGVIWTSDVHGNNVHAWASLPALGSGATPGTPVLGPGAGLNPPFGANGVEFNTAGDALFVANTAYHTIVKIPVKPDGTAGTASVFITGINAPDGIAIDKHDNIWICANQEDEIVVVDKTGKVIAKLGDFNGITADGGFKGFLFPASPAFSRDGKHLVVANLALYLPYAGAVRAIDSDWTLQVKRYAVSRISTRLPGQQDDD